MTRWIRLLPVLMLGALTAATLDGAAPSLPEKGASELSTFLQAAITRGDVPGAVVAVVGPDGLIYHEAFGKSSVTRNTAMTKDTLFNIASMTKAVTSAALLMLADEGKLSVDDPVAMFLPKYKDPLVITNFNAADSSYGTRPAKRPITIRHLLTHTSGIGYNFSSPTAAAVMRTTGKGDTDIPLLFDPGDGWAYGASTRVLGDVIVAITGQPLDRFLETRMLGPLGMSDTSYLVPATKYGRVVAVNARTNGAFVERPMVTPIPASVAGDGGLYSTASDYARFLQMLLNDGRAGTTRLLKARSVDAMLSPQTGSVVVAKQVSTAPTLSLDFPRGAGEDKWGLGFQLAKSTLKDRRSAGSGTWAGIFNTHFFIDPKKEIGVIVMLQTLPFYDEPSMRVYEGVEEIVYRNLK